MNAKDATSERLVTDIGLWLADQALQASEAPPLITELCLRMRAVGLPIARAQVTFNILHPLYDASLIRWTVKDGTITDQFSADQRATSGFQNSPINFALTNRIPVIRRRLTGPTALLDFPVLEEFRDGGGTDYLLIIEVFDAIDKRGVALSWIADRPTGFTDAEIGQMQHISRSLAIAMHSKIERTISRNVAVAYLGPEAGNAVLKGSIRRGDGEKIGVALWYSDLRQSTRLYNSLAVEDFLHVINRYFEMTAGSVADAGGEVVQFVGDSVLGYFRVEGDPTVACTKALAAAEEARRRLAAHLPEPGELPLDFGISLHLGHVIYGNIGVPARLQFSLIGSAVVEVVRVQDLTKKLNCNILATGAFASVVDRKWRSLGEHELRGFDHARHIFTPEPQATEQDAEPRATEPEASLEPAQAVQSTR
jgi:adenylate cyclase